MSAAASPVGRSSNVGAGPPGSAGSAGSGGGGGGGAATPFIMPTESIAFDGSTTLVVKPDGMYASSDRLGTSLLTWGKFLCPSLALSSSPIAAISTGWRKPAWRWRCRIG